MLNKLYKGGGFTVSKSGIVNVRMVITEEKILSNIDKVQKMINPNNKKQIIQLEDDTYFKDLIESIKTYLIEYPKKKNFPKAVYKAAYGLVEYATNQFEENTKRIEELIRQREKNINLANTLKETLAIVENKEGDWKQAVNDISSDFSEDIIETLGIIGRARAKKSQNYEDALKLINARIVNLESNLHIEIDMERIEDRSKALSYIGIEVADALKLIPVPEDLYEEETIITEQEEITSHVANSTKTEKVVAITSKQQDTEEKEYMDQTRIEVKPSLWQRIKNSKFVKTVTYIMKIKIVLQVPKNALPEGRGEI